MLSRNERRFLCWTAALFVCAVPLAANAHLGHVVTRAERYIKLEASDAETRLVVSLMLSPSEGQRVLQAADADRNGSVNEQERDAYLQSWGEALTTDLPVTVDGEAIEVVWGDPYCSPIGPVTQVALTVEMTARLPLVHRTAHVEIADHMRRETFDRTDVAFRARDGAELLRAGEGPLPTAVERDLAFGPLLRTEGPELFAADLLFARRSERASFVWPIGLGLAALLGALTYGIRRRRST